jgi:aminopeptidase N
MFVRFFTIACVAFGLVAAASAAYAQAPRSADADRFAKREWAARVGARERIERDQRAKAQIDQSNYDVQHYHIVLAIDPVSETIAGRVTAAVEATTTAGTLVFDLVDGLTVDTVLVDGTPQTFTHQNDLITVTLSSSLSQGEQADVAIMYSGAPDTPNDVIRGEDAFNFDTSLQGNPVIYTFSAPTFARAWWPCKDVLDDKATAHIVVTIPDTLVVASNGVQQQSVPNGDGTKDVTWAETNPIATYLVSLAISNYDVFTHYYRYAPTDSMPVVYYVYPEDRADAEIDFAPTVPMIQFYSGLFGQYPFVDEKYGMAEIGWSGGMEHQTCTSYGVGLITGNNRNDDKVAHELSHQWWGDMITCGDWRDVWLNEGFATYCEALWFENTDGRQKYLDYMDGLRYPFGKPFPGTVYDPDYLYDTTVYDKGAWVLHMLRWVMGDQPFFDAMRAYAADIRFAYRNAVTEEFQEVCEGFYGLRPDLDWFFDQWVYSEGEPAYTYYWKTSDSGAGQRVDIKITQTQSGFVYEMPIEIVLAMPTGDLRVTRWNNSRTQNYSFETLEPVTGVSVDPDGWILGDKTVGKTGDLPALAVTPNPFNQGTEISFQTSTTGQVSLTVYDVTGARVKVLQDGQLPPAFHSFLWNGRNDNDARVAAGVYYLDLHTPTAHTTASAVIVR